MAKNINTWWVENERNFGFSVNYLYKTVTWKDGAFTEAGVPSAGKFEQDTIKSDCGIDSAVSTTFHHMSMCLLKA